MKDRPTVLVPRQVLEGESIPEGVPELLSNAHVLLLGYHVLPEQTATEQARDQFGDKATKWLEQVEAMLTEAGATVETQLVFTHEGQQTINRVVIEEECDAVLVPGTAPTIEEILVPVRGTVGLDRTVDVLAGIFADSAVTITLFHVVESDEETIDAQQLLAKFEVGLLEAGLDEAVIETAVKTDENPSATIERTAEAYDVVVMGETDPSVATFIFGLPEEKLADRFLGPVFIVQRPPPVPAETESSSAE